MQRVLTNSQMREADKYTICELGVPSKVLMDRAGAAIARIADAYAAEQGVKRIVVVCGTGNNGGDGYVCASNLLKMGYDVEVYAAEGNLSPDCLRAKQAYNGVYTKEISGKIIIDCLFGTGLCRDLKGEYADIVNAVNVSGGFVISADIPSGLNGDNGLVCGAAVHANVTAAIAEYKFGHFLNDGPDCCGKLVKCDIGITCPGSGYALIPGDADIKVFFPRRKRNVNKGTFGTAQLIAGSQKYIGAAVLASGAALKSGCGYVKLLTDAAIRPALAVKLPQTVFTDSADLSASGLGIGPGCGKSKELYNTICRLLAEYRKNLIIDADGLNSLAEYGPEALKHCNCRVALTPHVKEFSRLCGLSVQKIIADPITAALSFAREYNVILLLKSSVSILTDGKNTVLLTRGNSALAKGGSGDMLTGFACGLAARGIDCFQSLMAASYIMGATAEICSQTKTEYCVTSKDIMENIHRAVKGLTD